MEQYKFGYVTLKYKPLSGVIEHNFFLLVVEIACSQISMQSLQRESNKSVSTALQDISCQGKVSLFMPALLIGFAGK